MKWWPPQRTWLPSIIAGVCLWLSPFVVFARHHDYALWRPEILAVVAVLAVIGALSGVIMETLGQYTRTLIWAALITLTVDIQMMQEQRVTILWIVFLASLPLVFLVRSHLPRFGTIIAAAVLLTSFFAPGGDGESVTWVAETKAPRNPSLPVYLHLILDEHTGVEGIPEAFDKDGAHARGLRDFYLDHGFQVFGRAHTHFYSTWASLANAFNFDYRGFPKRHHDTDGTIRYLTENAYFDLMQRRGYEIQVYQSAYLDYAYDKETTPVRKVVTWGLEVISAIQGSELVLADKIRIISGVYSRLSLILGDLEAPPSRLSTVSAMKMLSQVETDIAKAERGTMFVVHLMLPHYPYAYDADCNLYDDPWGWLMGYEPGLEKQRNTKESRDERYPPYLDQIACLNKRLGKMFDTFREAGLYDDMTILVHGDHGSRICQRPPDTNKSGYRISMADYVDSFSTLFAFKKSGLPARYDRRILPLGPLLEAVARHGRVPREGTEWAGKGKVFFSNTSPLFGARPMPNFQRKLDE